MTPVELSRTVLRAVRRAVDGGELSVTVPGRAVVTRPGPGGCGDYATNIALQLARPAGQPPRRVAEILQPHLSDSDGITDVVVTGPGFLNISLRDTTPAALVEEILRRGARYGFADRPTGEVVRLHAPDEVRAVVVMQATARLLVSQGALVRTFSAARPRPEWTDLLGVHVDASDNPGPRTPLDRTTRQASAPTDLSGLDVDARPASTLEGPAPLDADARQASALQGPAPLDANGPLASTPEAPAPHDAHAHPASTPDASALAPLDVTVRPVPAPADPTPLGRDAARWALLHPAAHDRPRITDEHLVQRESNPLFRVRYAHARTRALSRNAADLGFTAADSAEPGPTTSGAGQAHPTTLTPEATLTSEAALLTTLADHPRVLAQAAAHRAPDRLARHLVTVADAVLPFLPTVLPRGDEKPSAAHRARLALAEAAGAVLAGGLTLLGIDAPEHL